VDYSTAIATSHRQKRFES